jgi:metal-dependent amidase/aminoacylase/carboxypeptidase family protein
MSADVFLIRARAMNARGIVHGVHSSRFDLDEDALPIGTAALAQVNMDYVQKEGCA